MRIAVAQIDPVIGAFDANVAKIREMYERACTEQARLLLTPEMGICGYPPHDLIERPEIFDRCEKALNELAQITQGKTCILAVGYVARNPDLQGRAAQNVVSLLENGKEVFRQAKTLLPTYDVFDEARYFEPAKECRLFECDGKRVAVAICEDLWGGDDQLGRGLYGRTPEQMYRDQKAQIVVSLSSSPYEWGKQKRRETLHGGIARDLGAPLVYVNQVGANDEILFDGGSFAVNSKGESQGALPAFETGFGVFDTDSQTWIKRVALGAVDGTDRGPTEIERMHRGLVVGIRDYFKRTGFQFAIMGLSGGIDSAVVAALAAEAIGPQNVLGIAMPSQFSSSHSLEDAEILAKNLGLRFEVRPIKFSFSMLSRELGEARGGLSPLALENLQARLRGLTLMTLSNHYNALVLTTGNKSELATGYCTLYGDMCGALAPVGDLFKTRIYELAREINRAAGGERIPVRSITKAPSAELRPDQKDQDTLPPYPALDALLEGYLEKGMAVSELEELMKSHPDAKACESGWVRKILRQLEINEYKRRQAAPVLKISPKAFGIGRRIPIAKRWDQ